MMLRNRMNDESGVALVMALLGVVILSGLAVVFVGRATTETRAAAFSQNHESAIHVAEAAADRLIAIMADDPDHVTLDNDGDEISLDTSLADEDAESEWAIDLWREGKIRDNDLTSFSEGWLGRNVEGEAYAVRPRSEIYDDEEDGYPPADVIYAVSAVPSFEHPRAAFRVLKLQVDQAAFTPEFAFLTDGDFTFGGNAAIIAPGCDPANPTPEDCYADVHTNQGYSQSGTSSQIQGAISTSEPNCPANSTALLGCTPGAEEQAIPDITARATYTPNDIEQVDPANPKVVEWFDLCPNGDVRLPPADGVTTPCTGEVEWTSTGGNTRYRGWRFQASQNEWQASSVEAGVFYVYHADASINGSAGEGQRGVSVIVERDPANPTRSGSLSMTGNPKIQSALKGLLLLAESDLSLNGTAAAGDCGENPPAYSGLMYAGEQFNSQGTVELRGAVLVADKTDDHNLVKRNTASVSGTMCLEFDADLSFDLRGQWVVTFWNELRFQ